MLLAFFFYSVSFNALLAWPPFAMHLALFSLSVEKHVGAWVAMLAASWCPFWVKTEILSVFT